MTAIAKKLNYRRAGVNYAIELYDSVAEVGSDFLSLRVDGQTVYARIGAVDDQDASFLRVRKSSATYAVLNIARQELPSGFIAMFQSTCPSGWTRESSFDGYFLRGAATYNSTPQGSASHTHISAPGTVYTTEITEYYDKIDSNTNETNFAAKAHDHPFNMPNTTSTSYSHLPPYINIIFCRKD